MKSWRRQQGVAMLTALLIVAIAVVVVSSIFVQQRYSIRLSHNLQDMEQAYQYAAAAEKMAAVWLEEDVKQAKDGKYDALQDNWAAEIPPFEIDDDNGQVIGEVQVVLEDLQAYFNVNNVYDVKNQKVRTSMLKVFQQVLTAANLSPNQFSNAIVDWIDPNNELVNGDSAESDFYLTQAKPYKASNALILDTKELFLIKLDDATDNERKKELLAGLMPLITALPTPTALNINTASEKVLTAVGLTEMQAQSIVQERKNAPFKTMAELDRVSVKPSNELKVLLGVNSNYFRLSGQVRLGKSRLFLNSVLFRSADGKVRVIMRQFNQVPKPVDSEEQTES